MKGSGAKLLLQIWLVVFFLNAASPALCQVLYNAGACQPAMPSPQPMHKMSCDGCPFAGKKHRSQAPNCCELRVQDLGQNWHKQRTTPAVHFAPIAVLPNPIVVI